MVIRAQAVDPAAVSAAVAVVRERIRRAAGERPVELIAVTKGFDVSAIEAAAAAGCTAIGENYAQELVTKLAAVAPANVVPAVHFIGRLQTNKVRLIAALVDVWQSVDRAGLVDEIARRAPGAHVFVQVDATDEPGKGGCGPGEVSGLVAQCLGRGLVVDGLMTVGPTSAEPAATRLAFTLVRRMRDDLGLASCSMGMSGDLEIAIECGATHVRIGHAVFGARPVPGPRTS